ncbi:hypothetical protein LPJ75_005491 [Coemansia sp. RSA 2598]|nr:hypothetical protein LPJ75_005491 [Coemansia sp. RSA 2598]
MVQMELLRISRRIERLLMMRRVVGNALQQQQEQPCEYVVRTSPVSRCGSRSRSIQSNSNSNSSSSRNRSISQGSVETFQQPAASLFVEDIPNRHRDLSHAHESWQQGTGAADAPEMPLSSTTQQSVFLQPDGGQMHGSNRTAQNALGAGPLLHTSFVRSLLANSIAERMDEEDVEFQPTPVHSTGNSNSSSSSSNISRGSIGAGGDNAMDLDVSMLFDRHAGGGLACDTSYSRFNMRNDYPLEGLSGINSSFFASQDMPYQRCLGETTISDFGMSRYGNPFNPSIYQSYPIGLENRRSCDTLPEYAPTSALPPAYSLLSLSPHQHAGIQTCADMHNSNMSLAGGSGMPLNRSYSARGESARNSNPVLNVSYMSDSRSGLMDLVYFPRKMN